MRYWFKQIAKVLLLGIVVFTILYALGIFNPLEKECSDGTISNACSSNKPYFCKNGNFIYDANRCGCLDSQIIDNGACRELRPCSDGTMHNNCSLSKPLFCYDGNLSPNPSACGCPENYLFETGGCRLRVDCTDGTNDTRCSGNKPFYCYNGTLLKQASTCGCSEGYIIQGESCIDPKQIEKEGAKEAFEYLNGIRSSYNRTQLAWDDGLYDLAVFRSRDMYERGYFDHVTPEGKCVKDYKEEFGIPEGWTIAENAGGMTHYEDGTPIYGTSVKEAIDNWMDSRGHRYNLLYEKHIAGAVGCYRYICVFLGANIDPYGLGAGPCTTGAQGLEYWETVPTQPGEIK